MEDTRLEKVEEAEPELRDDDVEAGPEVTDLKPLPPNQERVLSALLSFPSRKEAARAAGVSYVTIWRYTNDDAFARRLREAQQAAVGHAALRLRLECEDAVTVLGEIMRQQDASPSARISAARSVVDYTIRVEEMDELRRRVDELEDFIRLKQEEILLDTALRNEEEGKR